MIVGIFDYLQAVADSGLPAQERNVLRALLTWTSHATWEAFPSVATIARAMGVDPRTVQRTMKSLYERQLVAQIRAHKSGTNVIRVDVERLEALAIERRNAEKGEGHDVALHSGEFAPNGAASPLPHRQGAPQTNQATNHERTMSTGVYEKVEKLLGKRADLLTHPNATPERLAYIARNANRKQNPTGWAITAIEMGYDTAGIRSPQYKKSRQVSDLIQRIRESHRQSGGMLPD